MKLHTALLSCVALTALAACSQQTGVAEDAAGDAGAAAPQETQETAMPADDAAACPVLESRNWTAWVNAMPGPDMKPALHVAGEIDLPTPGYTISWRRTAPFANARAFQAFRYLSLRPLPATISGMIFSSRRAFVAACFASAM